MSRAQRMAAVILSLVCFPAVGWTMPRSFFGEDMNYTQDPRTPADDPVQLEATPQADSARAAFSASIDGLLIEDFEGFAAGAQPETLAFGDERAILSGLVSVWELVDPVATLNGGYPISGVKFLAQTAVESFRIQFAQPQIAFGLYAIDVGDGGARLSVVLHYPGGDSTVVPVPNAVGDLSISGSVLYFGVIDEQQPFLAVTLRNSDILEDGFAFDDMAIAWHGSTGVHTPRGPSPQMTIWPNPSSGRIDIRFGSPLEATGQLTIFDIAGRVVRVLPTGRLSDEGVASWDGRTEDGRALPSGVYIVAYRGTGLSCSRLVTLLH